MLTGLIRMDMATVGPARRASVAIGTGEAQKDGVISQGIDEEYSRQGSWILIVDYMTTRYYRGTSHVCQQTIGNLESK